jgi:membrane associated rhomboid family serine protease
MATLSIRQLHLGDALDFLLTASPLIVGILIVPTLAAASGREHPSFPLTLPLRPAQLRQHFLWSHTSPWYTAVSHVLCHANADHQAGNLSTLLLTGTSVHAALGRVGWWVTILGGALTAAADPFQWRDKQTTNWLNAWTYDMLPSFTPAVARAWTSSGAWAACGASAAISAQCGAEAALCLHQFLSLISLMRDSDGHVPDTLLIPTITHALMLSRAVTFVLTEHGALSTGASLTIGHGAHLTGFGWGVLCYAGYALARRYRWRGPWTLRRERLTGQGSRDRGHRLGGR